MKKPKPETQTQTKITTTCEAREAITRTRDRSVGAAVNIDGAVVIGVVGHLSIGVE